MASRCSSRPSLVPTPALLAVCAVLFGFLAAAPSTAQPRAGDCVIGPGLGSTLLVPYWEVDQHDPAGFSTLVSVHNALATPTLVRVVLWTDWAVPTLAFDVYLAGFDIQTFNLRDLLNGVVPSTGMGADLSVFSHCFTFVPFHDNPVLSVAERAQVVAWHTGKGGPLNPLCAGRFRGGDADPVGYLTVDVVKRCSGVEVDPYFTPANTIYPYFASGDGSGGVAKIDNRLWGDVLYVDPANAAAQGLEAVSKWADASLFSGTDVFTFYGRYSDWDGRDKRVPLPWRWDQRFLNGGPFAGGAILTVWRDTGVPSVPISCDRSPSWWPLEATTYAMNEDGGGYVELSKYLFQDATQRVSLNHRGIPYSFGWVQVSTGRSQSWVISTLTARGLFSAGIQGTPVEFLCNETPP